MKENNWFKEVKKTKKKREKDAMDFAKDALVLTAGVVVLGTGLSLLD